MKRDYTLDVMRVVAMFMIVLMHSPKPGSAPGIVLVGLTYLTIPAIGLFFMISGALLIDNKLGTKEFLKRRFSKILWPTIFWTLVYLFVKHLGTETSASVLLKSIFSIPFTAQGHGVLWFMYTLAGLYLLTPILSKWGWVTSGRELRFYLFLWVISLCFPYLKLIGLEINESETSILYYFSGYVGYFVLGYYLQKYYRPKLWVILIALIIGVACPLGLIVSKVEYDFLEMMGYLSLPAASLSFVYWSVLKQIKIKRHSSWLLTTSSLGFGIYLSHILLMRSFIWDLQFVAYFNGILQIAIIAITTFASSWLLCYIIKKLPFSKYIIGV